MEARRNKKEGTGSQIQKSNRPLDLLPDYESLSSEFLRIAIDGSIEDWEKGNGRNSIRNLNLWGEKREELIRFLPEIRKFNKFIFRQVKKFLSQKRIYSLLKKEYGIRENIRSQPIQYTIEKDEKGKTKDFSINTAAIYPPASLFGHAIHNPEESLYHHETHLQILNLLGDVESSGRRHASTYRQILEMELLDQINVTPEHGPVLGVAPEKVTSLKHQAFELAREIVANKYPDLPGIKEILKKGTNHKIKKSTKKERSANHDGSKKSGPIRWWTRGQGERVLSYEEAVELKKKEALKKKKPNNSRIHDGLKTLIR